MDGFQHPEVARLARAVFALRLGRTLTTPDRPIPLGTVSERFVLDTDPVQQELMLLHSITLTGSGIAAVTPFSALDWSIGALMIRAAHWPEAMLAALPAVPDYASERAMAFLRRLDAGEPADLGPDRFQLAPRSPSPENLCRVAITTTPRDAPWSATRLILMP